MVNAINLLLREMRRHSIDNHPEKTHKISEILYEMVKRKQTLIPKENEHLTYKKHQIKSGYIIKKMFLETTSKPCLMNHT